MTKPTDILEEMAELLSQRAEEQRNETVQAHYGVDIDESMRRVRQMLADFIMSMPIGEEENKTKGWHTLLDKHYPDMSAEQRARVFEFGLLFNRAKEIEGIC